MATASTVTVNITAETAKFENGLKKSKKAASGFGSAIADTFKVAAVGTALLIGALAKLTSESLALVDTQRKTARSLGTTQAVFSGLSLAAGIAGVSTESFTKSLKKQSKAIIDANDGLQTQARAFQRLGLNTKELINLSLEDQFKTITGALEKVENSTLKVGIASDIYGSKNVDLINILELGSAGIDKYLNKVKELGVALTDRQTNAIEKANDAILVMKTAFVGLGNQIAARVSPAITKVAGFIENLTSKVTNSIPKWAAWAAEIFGVKRNLDNLTLADLNEELKLVDAQMNEAQGRLNEQKRAFKDDIARGGNLAGGKEIEELPVIIRLTAQLAEVQKRYNDIIKERLRLKKSGEVATPSGGVLSEGDMGVPVDPAVRFNAAIAATRTPLEQFQIRIAEIRNDLTTNGLWEPELAQREAQMAVDAYLKEYNRIPDEQKKIMEGQKAAAESATRSVATPLEELNFRIAEIRNNLETNPFWSPETAQRQSQEAVDAYLAEMKRLEEVNKDIFSNMTEFQSEAFRNMQDILSEFLFDPFEDGLKGMLKGFIDMLRKMVANLLAQKILTAFFSSFGGVAGGGGGSTAGAGFRSLGPPAAIGGPRSAQPLMVGERGPEVFSPGASGSIRPLGSVNIEQNNSFGGDGGGLTAATLVPILENNNKKVKAEILDAFDRGAFV